jgi:hypothetical protein
VGSVDEDRRISVSPRHRVLLAEEYLPLVKRAPKRDFVVRTVVQRQANDLLLMTAELVIAGEETRALHPLAVTYPLHFKKTYFPGQFYDDPKIEFDNSVLASRVTSLPPPIGYASNIFRSCLLPGTAYARLSPFGVDPPERNVPVAEKVPLESAAGLWLLAEQALAQLLALQDAGLAHGDAELHNCIVCPTPLELLFIDFGSSVHRSRVDADGWEARCARDLEPILREAVFLQCALGRQVGPLAELSWDRIDRLFASPDRFRRVIERHPDV